MEKRINFNISKRVNLIVLMCHSVINIALSIAYWTEVLSGNRTREYFIAFCAIAYIPNIICWVIYRIKNELNLIQYFVAIAYMIMYTFALFTGNTTSTFTYIYPFLVIIPAYFDMKFTIAINIAALVINIAKVAYGAVQTGYEGVAMTDAKIQIGVTSITCIFSVIVSSLIIQINKSKLEEIQAEKNTVSDMLQGILTVSREINQSSVTIDDKMGLLEEAMTETEKAMDGVKIGANDTAETMQEQLTQTDAIKESLDHLLEVLDNFKNSIGETKSSIDLGNVNISDLLQNVGISVEASNTVASEIDTLSENASKMNSIIELIKNVADQTSLLALNAAIEAARAGEAGKGFSVVASEISELAKQTKSASDDISKLINSINVELEGVVAAVGQLIISNGKQNESAEKTVESFNDIESNTNRLNDETNVLSTTVTKLADVNSSIIQGVENVSATLEEVAAHANETYSNSHANMSTVLDVKNLVVHLRELADGLNQGSVGY